MSLLLSADDDNDDDVDDGEDGDDDAERMPSSAGFIDTGTGYGVVLEPLREMPAVSRKREEEEEEEAEVEVKVKVREVEEEEEVKEEDEEREEDEEVNSFSSDSLGSTWMALSRTRSERALLNTPGTGRRRRGAYTRARPWWAVIDSSKTAARSAFFAASEDDEAACLFRRAMASSLAGRECEGTCWSEPLLVFPSLARGNRISGLPSNPNVDTVHESATCCCCCSAASALRRSNKPPHNEGTGPSESALSDLASFSLDCDIVFA